MVAVSFITAIICMIVLLYVPGFLLLRATHRPLLASALFAPPISLACYGIEEIIFAKISIAGSWLTIFVPLTVIAAVLYAIRIYHSKKHHFADIQHCDVTLSTIRMVSSYVGIALILTLVLFLTQIGGLSTYSQLFDNAWHMGIIRKFITVGDYSTLNSGNIIASVGSKFYPTGWHSLVALTVSMTGVSIPVAINASIAMILCLVYPLSMFVLARQLFADNTRLVWAMSLTVLMFAIFPWRFLVYGSLYSNLMSFAMLPLAIALCLRLLNVSTTTHERWRVFVLLLITIVGIALTQPNSIFTMGILVAPYMFSMVPHYVALNVHGKRERMVVTAVVTGVLFMMIIAVWVMLYCAPFMQRTVKWGWPPFVSKWQSVIDVLFLGFHNCEPQFVLGALVIVGMIYTLCNRRYLWISCAYIIMCGLYALAASTDGRAKAILTGFWYHDAYRLGASAVFFGAALAAIGCVVCFDIAMRLVDGIITDTTVRSERQVLSVVLVLLLFLANFFPTHYFSGTEGTVETAFGAIRRDIRFWNRLENPKSYTAEESAFVKRVLAITKHNMVINHPYDGSVYAWGVDGLNVYYKAWEGNWMGVPTEDNMAISTKLNQFTKRSSVCRALRNIHARYVLLLDRSDYGTDPENTKYMKSIYASYEKTKWAGIDAIDDQTPGLRIILREGSMRLYEITGQCATH